MLKNDPTDSPSDLVAQGAPISQLQRHFSSKAETLNFYAQTTVAKYNSDLRIACCKCYATPDFAAIYTWRAVYGSHFSPRLSDLIFLFVGHIRIRTAASYCRFSTRHPFCNSCWRATFLNRSLANILQFFSLFLGIISGFIAPVMFSVYFYFLSDPSWRRDLPGTLLTAIGSTLVFVLCVAAFFLSHRLRVPAPLRNIPRYPFRFESMKKQPL